MLLQYLERQVEFRRNENELGYLVSKKGALWRYCVGLERLLEPEGRRHEEGYFLRPAGARFDIAFTDGAGPETVTSEEDMVGHLDVGVEGGKLLHR